MRASPRRAWLWMLLFGIFYLIARQSWVQVAVLAGMCLATSVLCAMLGIIGLLLWPLISIGIWVYYATSIRTLLAKDYLRRGWHKVDLYEATIEMPY